LAAWVLLYLQVDPVPTWFYVLAWYPTLALLDAVGTRIDGRPSALWRRPMIFALAWSPIVWLLFEAANFRLQNWYYVFLPHTRWERWTGIILSFATVLPALFLAERILDAAGVFRRGRGPVIAVGRRDLWGAVAIGAAMGALALGFPRIFFPLVWGAVVLIVDPLVLRRAPDLSLIGDLARGYWGRIGRIMLGGMGIGLVWEAYNFWARGKWIYTVPWLENVKLFEMPPFGFLGFPVFALEAWAMYSALCVFGLAKPIGAPRRSSATRGPRQPIAATAAAVSFAVLVLLGMEHWTISSTVPRVDDLPGLSAASFDRLEAAGISDPYELAQLEPIILSAASGLDSSTAARVVAGAQLTTLRGVGAQHAAILSAVGVSTVCDLAQREAAALKREIGRRQQGPRPNIAEVRVWVRAAARTCRS